MFWSYKFQCNLYTAVVPCTITPRFISLGTYLFSMLLDGALFKKRAYSMSGVYNFVISTAIENISSKLFFSLLYYESRLDISISL